MAFSATTKISLFIFHFISIFIQTNKTLKKNVIFQQKSGKFFNFIALKSKYKP